MTWLFTFVRENSNERISPFFYILFFPEYKYIVVLLPDFSKKWFNEIFHVIIKAGVLASFKQLPIKFDYHDNRQLLNQINACAQCEWMNEQNNAKCHKKTMLYGILFNR